MEPNGNRVILADGVCDCHTVHSAHAHHRDFPEIQAEGESSIDAVAQLVNQLTVALDTAPDIWHREAVEQAIADVKSLAEQRAWDFGSLEPAENIP